MSSKVGLTSGAESNETTVAYDATEGEGACTAEKPTIPTNLLKIWYRVVDDVTFFELAVGLTGGGALANRLKQSAWQRVQDEWKMAQDELKKAQHGTEAETESEPYFTENLFTEKFNKKVGF